ncbi:lycopene cyclase domain-containing protein [Microbacterium oleivorans]|uniref:lycopene cyclase domain-containing protein n=1 Tax=Microbacterium oleivorans TaxID=273677 RepID=UPI0020424CD1|nr:lycopene cyclase domain-containing protein [Microbacterium oleivorans]MCM3696272.1 lycopene cyclase domain-containing protein [Microbacterium oleivorans]
MTYPLLIVPFAAVTVIVTLVSLRRPGARERFVASLWTALVLIAFTAVFDNLMIAADLFTYPEEHISGIRVGLAPIEDFSYPLCAAFLLPAIGALLPSRTETA